MFKQFTAFQKMLFYSIQGPEANMKQGIVLYIFIFIMIFSLTLTGFNMAMVLSPIVSFSLIYIIVNSKKRIYDLAPVSSKYALVNIHLFQPIAAVIIHIMFSISTLIFAGVILLIVLISDGTIESGGPEVVPVSESSISFEGVMFIILLYALFWFGSTAIALIKNDRLRVGALIGGVVAIVGSIRMIDSILPTARAAQNISFLHRFSEASHASEILLGLGLLTLLVIPLSIKASRKLYNT